MKRRASLLLGVGAAIGMMLALTGALVNTESDVSVESVAWVNGKAITRPEVERVLQRLSSTRATTPDEQREAVQRLIDQELLVQRGVAIGLLESDRTVRKALVMAMIDAIVAEVVAQEPTDAALRAFYDSHTAVFTLPMRLQVEHIFCGGHGDLVNAHSQAEHVSTALAQGLSFHEARARYGGEDSVPLPQAAVPLPVLRRSLGPTLTDAVLALSVGDISPPLWSSSGYHILHLVDRQPAQVPAYATISQEVRAEYLHRQRDAALQAALDRARHRATILLSPHAPRVEAAIQGESRAAREE